MISTKDKGACEHDDFDEYFTKCNDCGTSLDDMVQAIQDEYNKEMEG